MNKYLNDNITIDIFIKDFIEFCKPYKDYDDENSNESVFIDDLKYFLEKNDKERVKKDEVSKDSR